MGNFYTNFTILGADRDEVLAVAAELNRETLVLQSGPRITMLFDEKCDQQHVSEIEFLGQALSTRLAAAVIASLNHDDDHLLLWVFWDEKQQGFYQSIADAPDFAWTLSRVRGGVLAYPFIVLVLGWPIVLFQILRHKALVALLGLPPLSAGFGYTYLSQAEEIPPGDSDDDGKNL